MMQARHTLQRLLPLGLAGAPAPLRPLPALPVNGAGAAGGAGMAWRRVEPLNPSASRLGTPAVAGAPLPSERLARQFAFAAGGAGNAGVLVSALRTAAPCVLCDPSGSIEFAAPQGVMAWTDVEAALALAVFSLRRAGLSSFSLGDLKAALSGGVLQTPSGVVRLEGVLNQRARGLRWGQIALQHGTHMGQVLMAARCAGEPGQGAVTEPLLDEAA